MTEEEYLALCKSHWESFQKLNESTNLYDHEKDLEGMLINLGRDILQKSVGPVGQDHRKKKSSEPFGDDRNR
jgi:hypothetical protein